MSVLTINPFHALITQHNKVGNLAYALDASQNFVSSYFATQEACHAVMSRGQDD